MDETGCPQRITRNGDCLNLVPYRPDLDLQGLTAGTMDTAAKDTPMRTAVEINHTVDLPVPVIDRKGRLLGVVGRREILEGILR
jgi:CBS-domain-containing membrane protein